MFSKQSVIGNHFIRRFKAYSQWMAEVFHMEKGRLCVYLKAIVALKKVNGYRDFSRQILRHLHPVVVQYWEVRCAESTTWQRYRYSTPIHVRFRSCLIKQHGGREM